MEQKSIVSRVLDAVFSHNLLRIVLVVMVLLRSCTFLSPIVGPFVKVTLVWSIIILVHDLFTRRLLLTNRFRGVLYLFLIAYGITTLVNWQVNLVRNVVMLGYMCVNMLVVYAYDTKESPEKSRRELAQFNLAFMITSFAGQLFSFITFILNLRFTYMLGEDKYYYGIYNGRIWGFFNNPNAASFIAVISIMLTVVSVMLRRKQGKHGWNFFYVANIVMQLLILFLCNSRGSILVMSFYLFMLPVLILLPGMMEKASRKAAMKKAAIFAVLLPLALAGAHEYAMDVLPNFVIPTNFFSQQIEKGVSGITEVDENEDLELNEEGEVELQRQDYGSKYGGRYYLWRAGLKLIEHHPLFGVGNDNVPDYTTEYARIYFTEEGEEPYLPGVQSGLHNLFFQIAAASGLVGLAIFLVFGVFVIIRTMRFFIRSLKEKKYDPIHGIYILVAAVILLRTMTDTGIIYGVYYLSVVFWMYMAQSMRVIDSTYPEDKPDLLARLSDRIFSKKNHK